VGAGNPLHDPVLAVNVDPTVAVPEIVGATVLAGELSVVVAEADSATTDEPNKTAMARTAETIRTTSPKMYEAPR
jgi:hydroxymethylglutaryl-CoA reductase